MAKETKTRAELQAIFRAELNKLGMHDTEKVTIQPVANNARVTWAILQADGWDRNNRSTDKTQDTIRKALQDRYDLSDDS